MSTEPIDSISSSSFNAEKPSGGQTSNDYVRKLVEDKLAEYETKLHAMRINEERNDNSEGQSIKTKSAEDFINLKIQQLRELYVKMNKELLSDNPDLT